MSDKVVAPSVARALVLLSIPVLAYFSCSAGRKALEIYDLHRQSEQLRAEISALQERHQELQRQIEYLRSDEYVEKVAREELNLVKPGDTTVVVVTRPVSLTASVTSATTAGGERHPSPWEQWWAFLFGR